MVALIKKGGKSKVTKDKEKGETNDVHLDTSSVQKVSKGSKLGLIESAEETSSPSFPNLSFNLFPRISDFYIFY